MLIASCRQNFTSTRRLSRALQFREVSDPAPPGLFTQLALADLQTRAANRRVCLIVHGFNTTFADVLDAYGELQAGMERTGVAGPAGYGLLVGFAWPGWHSAPGFLLARTSAERAGRHLLRLVNHLRPGVRSLDIQTHSLGARVALAALKNRRSVLIDNLLLSAPAVDGDILDPAREFHSSLAACTRCLVYHSRRDKALKQAFLVGDFADGIQKALGLIGPRHPKITLEKCPNVYTIDCTACVPDHGAYRHADAFYAHWLRVLSGAPLPRTESLSSSES